MAKATKDRVEKLVEEHVEPEIITIGDICGIKLIKDLEGLNFLTFNMKAADGELYSVAVPEVLIHNLKEVSKDGESGAGCSGVQEATEIEAGRSEQQEDQTGSEGEDEGTATE